MNLDTLTFIATAPSTGAAMAIATGDSASVRNAAPGKDILCLAAWAKGQAVGTVQVTWPSGHDLVRGIRARTGIVANSPENLVPRGFPWPFRPQDPITVTKVGSATGGDVELFHMLMWYEDLPGTDGRLINVAQLRKFGVNVLTIEDSITITTAGQYGGSRALNAASDLLKADTDYAIVGGGAFEISAGALCVRGVDIGNLRCAIPGGYCAGAPGVYNDWFMQLSEFHDLPCIPVFNSSNRAGIFVDGSGNENATATPFHLNLVELGRKRVGAVTQ